MGLLDTIMFWRKKDQDTHLDHVDHIDGFEVDGCFTLPDARLDDIKPVETNDDAC